MKTKILLLGMMLFLLTFNSCDNKDDVGNSSTLTAEEANVNAKIDVITEDISRVIENQLNSDDGLNGRNAQGVNSCPTVTRVPALGTTLTPGTLITKTIDFGIDGCPLTNGNILKGKIIITFTYEPNATSHTINYSFDNFYHNNIKINGNKSFTRTMTTATANSPSHPMVTMNMDLTATFPNGNIYTRVGTRVREIIAGYGTSDWNDNVYQVTGNWATTLPNGAVQTSTITTPLRIRMNCIHIVSGVITIVRNNVTAILDYGNEEDCDNLATVTINGVTHVITLGN